MPLRPAASPDAGRIVEILRANFPADRLPFCIYGCAGLEAYIADLLRTQEHSNSLWQVLVTEDTTVQGFTEVRRSRRSLFLNHAFLDSSVRGPGIGTGLLYRAILHARDATQPEIALDVFHDNVTVHRGHRAVGYRKQYEAWWLECPLPEGLVADNPWYVQGLGQADHVHQRYDFSEFSLETSRGQYRIGRLGAGLFRVTDLNVLNDPDVGKALAHLDSARRLLLIGPADQLGEDRIPRGVVRARVYRMAAETEVVLQALAPFSAF